MPNPPHRGRMWSTIDRVPHQKIPRRVCSMDAHTPSATDALHLLTHDYGTTWTRISTDVWRRNQPHGSFVRVVRTDTSGTGCSSQNREFRLCPLFDDGVDWQSLMFESSTTLPAFRDMLIRTTIWWWDLWSERLESSTTLTHRSVRSTCGRGAQPSPLFNRLRPTALRRNINAARRFPPEIPTARIRPLGAIICYQLGPSRQTVYITLGHLGQGRPSVPTRPSRRSARIRSSAAAPDCGLLIPEPMHGESAPPVKSAGKSPGTTNRRRIVTWEAEAFHGGPYPWIYTPRRPEGPMVSTQAGTSQARSTVYCTSYTSRMTVKNEEIKRVDLQLAGHTVLPCAHSMKELKHG